MDECTLTKAEAYAVAEFIEMNIFTAIRNDVDFDSAYCLMNLIHVLEKAAKYSGYTGVTLKPEGEQEE